MTDTETLNHDDLPPIINAEHSEDEDDDDDANSVDEALMEMLGITSFDAKDFGNQEHDENTDKLELCLNHPIPIISNEHMQQFIQSHHFRNSYTINV